MRSATKISELLTPSEEAIYGFLTKTTRWLTLYEISMLTGCSYDRTRTVIGELRKKDRVIVRERIYGFDNGEREFKGKTSAAQSRKEKLDLHRFYGVPTFIQRLECILGRKKAREAEQFFNRQ